MLNIEIIVCCVICAISLICLVAMIYKVFTSGFGNNISYELCEENKLDKEITVLVFPNDNFDSSFIADHIRHLEWKYSINSAISRNCLSETQAQKFLTDDRMKNHNV